MRTVITGANRGIGLELCRQLLARGGQVEAAVRDPGRAGELRALAPGAGSLHVHACDVASDPSVEAFAAELLHESPAPVDLLINNAAVYGERSSLESLDLEDVRRTFEVNALGPLRVTRALLPLLRRSDLKKIAHVTSLMGSIAENTGGGSYGYRMAKCALNMASKNLALELGREGMISIVVNPGWVQTDMGGQHAPTPVADSVSGILRAIDDATPLDSGRFLDYRGRELPW